MASWVRCARDIRGFTLVELLAVVGIIALIFVLGLTKVTGVQDSLAVRSAARGMATEIRWLQQRALADGKAWRLDRVGPVAYAVFRGDQCDGGTYSKVGANKDVPGGVTITFNYAEPVVFACTGRRITNRVQAITLTKSDYRQVVEVSPLLGRVTIKP